MNILGFGLVFGGGMDLTNTTLNGGNTRAKLAYWFVSQVFFEGKLRALFSMLFGAGVVLLITRGDERGAGLRVADIFYRRTMWLILFGVLHAYFIWGGDILYPYGLFGMFLFPLRKANPKWLLIAGITLFYGYGFNLFGKLQRYQLLYVVLAVWAFLLLVSPIWLRHFRYGPMEWVWRSLTYWQKQPMKLRTEEPIPHLEPSATLN